MANPGVAVPGSVVATGSQVSPAGPQGIQGPSTVSANANNKATLGSDSLLLVQGTAAGVAATTHTQTVSGDDPQLTNARTPTAHEASHVTGSDQIPNASNSARGFLNQLSGNTTDFVDGTNTCQNLVTAIQPTIWSARLRSINILGNPTFEVSQRNINNVLINPAHGTMIEDRWAAYNNGSLNPSFQVAILATARNVPGTSFGITRAYMRLVVGTVKSSLAATDIFGINTQIEGARWRELANDVHSISLLMRSNVNCKLGISLRDAAPPTKSLTKLVTLTANTDTLVQLPNLPAWPAGNFTLAPGSISYQLGIILAAGSTYLSPANDTFQAGNFLAATGQDNYLANPVNSEVDIFFVQHEPGAPTMPIDCPFQQAYDDALRYYQKSYSYPTALGTISGLGIKNMISLAAASAFGSTSFSKPMAKAPTVTLYNHATGTAGSIRDGNAVDHASAAAVNIGDSGFPSITYTTASTSTTSALFHYTADTGW